MSFNGEDFTDKPAAVLDRFGYPASHLTPAQRDRILRQLTVPIEDLPQPLPWTVSFLKRSLPNRIAINLNVARWKANRPLSSDEANAFAEMSSRAIRARGRGIPVWLGVTWYMEKQGRETFRFPWYQPSGMNFQASAWPHPKLAYLQGAAAMRAWHATRFAAYGTVLYYAIVPFFGFYGEMKAILGATTDPRLKAYNEEGVKRQKQRQGGLPSTTVPPAQQLPGNQEEERSTGTNDWPTAPEEQQQPAQLAQRRHQPPSWSTPSQPQSRSDEDDSFLFDDASPVASTERKPQPTTASSSGTTSWQQLRDRAKAGDNTWSQEDSRAGRPQGGQRDESYTYSENDRNYAKDQAQKEFDAMLEKERSGKGDGNGRY